MTSFHRPVTYNFHSKYFFDTIIYFIHSFIHSSLSRKLCRHFLRYPCSLPEKGAGCCVQFNYVAAPCTVKQSGTLMRKNHVCLLLVWFRQPFELYKTKR